MSGRGEWVRNPRYAEHAGCPACRVPLVMLPVPVRFVSDRQLAADDERIVERVSDGFKAGERSRGWRHVATMRCPECGRTFSPAQAARFDWRPGDLPPDWWVRPAPSTPEAAALAFAALSASLSKAARSRREDARARGRDPANGVPTGGVQERLPLDAFTQQGTGEAGPGKAPGPENG